MIFQHLRLENWRNFKAVDVALGDRVFIVGPNAAGKSNLLDAFRFLRDIAQEGGGGLQRAVQQLRGGLRSIRSLHARNVTDVVVSVDVGEIDQPRSWSYRLVLGSDNRGLAMVRGEEVWDGETPILSRPVGEQDVEERRSTYLENPRETKGFRNLVHFFRSIEYSHLVPQIIRETRTRPEDGGRDPFGADLLAEVAETTKAQRTRRLKLVNDALSAVLPQFSSLELEKDERGRPHLITKYKHWRGIDAKQREDQFSDGTLRLIGLLWSLSGRGGPLLLEEPELSLHAAAVRNIPQMLARVSTRSHRQIILTTHSEEIYDDTGISPEEILMLTPTNEGTTVEPASSDATMRELASRGHTFAKELTAKTRAADVDQLTFKFR
jgi:predicted ATPase